MYTISIPPSLYFGRFVNVAVQLFSTFAINVCFSSPFAYSVISTLSGLIPSWLFASSHTFVATTSVVAGIYVFVTVYPFTDFIYPCATTFSSIVYTISFPPFLYFGRFVNIAVQLFSAFTVVVCFSSPSAYNVISTFSGLIPSWLFASSHIFVATTSVVSGTYVFVTIYPFTDFVYLSATIFSSTV